MKKILTSIALAAFATSATTSKADIIGFEDFDGGAINLASTVNVFNFGSGGGTGGDAFGVVSPFNGGTGTGGPFDVWDDSLVDMSGGGVFAGDGRGLAGQRSTAFFAMVDSDGFQTPPLNNAVWTFDISSALSLTDITIDIGAIGDFESASLDGFLVEAQIDGGGFQSIFQGITDESASKTYRLMDDGTVPVDTNDPLELFIDGVATGIFLDKADRDTGLFDTYTSVLFAGQSGSSLDIRISWAGSPSGSEAMGFDNITINGAVPEPASAGILALTICGLGFVRRRR